MPAGFIIRGTIMKSTLDPIDTESTTVSYVREVIAKYIGVRRVSVKISGPQDVHQFALKVVKDNSREHFLAFYLDAAHQVISYATITTGTANSTQVHPREVFQYAILSGAVAVTVAHNHPSGSVTPSEADRTLTRQLADAGKLMAIPVLDHVVFCEDVFYSFAENGCLR